MIPSTTFNNELLILSFKAATEDLLPIFARHFADIRLIVARDRMEVSASFRSPAELNLPKARQRAPYTIQPSQTAAPPAPMRVDQPATTLAQPKEARAVDRRRLALTVVSSLAAVILGWSLLGNLHKSGDTRATPTPSERRGSIPGWAPPGLDETSLGGWIEVQTRFDLPDATVRSTIQILQANDKYPAGHDLHDLAKYPAQARRAFSLLAGTQTGTPFDFGALNNDLEGRLVAGVRFPDEPPGERYSLLQRELYKNVVVLAIIDFFHRRQDDPRVKDILAALRRGRT